MAIATQGVDGYQLYNLSEEIFTKDIALKINDSNSPPTMEDVSVLGIFIRIRTGGNMVFWNGSTWNILNKDSILIDANNYTDTKVSTTLPFESYTNFTDIPLTGSLAFITCDIDNSQNGDNTESQFIRQNNKLFYIVAVEQ